MNRNHHLLWVIVAVAALLAATPALAWHSAAATVAQGDRPPSHVLGEQLEASAVVDPVPGGPEFYTQTAFAFRPSWPNTEGVYNGVALCNPGPSNGYFQAPLSLPHGAVVTKFVGYFNDSAPLDDLLVYLLQCPLAGPMCHEMATIVSTGSHPESRTDMDTTIVRSVIDNQSNAYLAEVYLPASADYGICLTGIRVDYTFPAPVSMPLVQKGR